jgi:hypothetical protein
MFLLKKKLFKHKNNGFKVDFFHITKNIVLLALFIY